MNTSSTQYRPGQLIPLEPMPHFVVRSGCVASYILTADGRRVIDALYPPGTGYIPVSPDDMDGYTARSAESALKHYIALGTTEVCTAFPPTRMQVNAALTYSSHFFAVISTLDAWRGVLYFMLEFGETSPLGGTEMRLLQSLIGDVIRYTRESVSNAVSRLKREGVLKVYKDRSQPIIHGPSREDITHIIFNEARQAA
ncbi:Crp/Fnr family transcriptional regulator [Deinococcus sp. 6YEL10]|uniref:hypothetical protein n=1 Tax=Deinococcus sp. 6YEL10 TaxID=2745870 RepID=UPI001E564407|nr:hypothetical protein [Deinococcus sp. 6YEL10]MCD0159798.1 Crp/Fnr family transcriptional regulator [Deinococcus sp. 6YEL10]